MADLYSVLDRMRRERMFERLATNTAAQFGPPQREYLGARLMPERTVPENYVEEDTVRYRAIIANDGTRYSPTQIKGEGLIYGQWSAALGDSDIAREFTSRDYDILLKVLGAGRSMEAMTTLIRWVDNVIIRALVEKNEAQRWDCLVNASVVRRGDNGLLQTVAYPNPAGSRVAAGGQWSNNAYDPYPDMIARVDYLTGKGFTCNRIITDRATRTKLLKNTNMVNRLTRVVVLNGDGTVGSRSTQTRITVDDLNALIQADGLPAIETNDLTYNTEAANVRFFPANTMLFLCTTGRDEEVIVGSGDTSLRLFDTLGYYAIGRSAGQQAPGRVIKIEAFERKPPRVEAEGWQTGLPIMTEPEAVAAITGIT